MEDYRSRNLGNLYFDCIKEDMNKFSEIAKEVNTTTENILLYAIALKLNNLDDTLYRINDVEIHDLDDRLYRINDTLEELVETIKNKED